MNRRERFVCLVAVALSLMLLAPVSMAWQEGPGTNWWYINANYGGYYSTPPLVIEINGDPSAGQTFVVGDTVNITCYLHAYAVSCGGEGNEAYTNATLEVKGASGFDFDNEWGWDSSDQCAEVETIETFAIAYTLTAAGIHQIYMNSNVQVAQYWTDVAKETVEALLTFDVVMPMLIIDGCDTGVQDQVLPDGSLMSAKISECATNARNHGQFVSCVAHLTNEWKGTGYITGKEKGAIQSCAARADLP